MASAAHSPSLARMPMIASLFGAVSRSATALLDRYIMPLFRGRHNVMRTRRLAFRDRDLQREIVDHLVPGVGHDEGVAEKDPERAVGRDRVRLRHDDHAGLKHHVDLFTLYMLGADMRVVGDEIDAVALRRPRLHALVAEELRRNTHVLGRLA